jgi:uncharacterized protein (TIGR02117 family)
MRLFRINGLWPALRALIAWPLLLIGLYMFAALAGGLIPVNASKVHQSSGHIVYIYDNDIHTSIVFPRIDGSIDIAETLTKKADFPGDKATYPWIMVGWGDHDFFLNTPSWAEVKVQTLISAIMGSGASLIHIDRITQLPPRERMRRLVLTDAQYAKLLGFITPQMTLAPNGEPQSIKGYSTDDQFYRSAGRDYSILYTCNNWVGEALEKAGVRTGYWTPLPFGVMWWD